MGLGKTGTSAIQLFLRENIQILKQEYRILYPCIESDPRPFKENHSIILSSLFVPNAHQSPVNIAHGFNTKEKLGKLNQQTHNELKLLFKDNSVENLLLSAEGISTMRRSAVTSLFEWLHSISEEIKIIACIRHPFDGLASEIQQQLKNGKVLEEMYENPQVKGARRCLRKILDHFNKSQIISYDFVDATSHPQGIIGKFLEAIEIPNKGFKQQSNDVTNVSMSLEACLLLSALNNKRPKYQNGKIGGARFAKDLRFFLDLPGNKFRIPPNIMLELHDKIQGEVKWLDRSLNLIINSRNSNSKELINFSKEAMAHIAHFTKMDESWIYDQFSKEWELHNKSSKEPSKLKDIALKISDLLNTSEEERLRAQLRKIKFTSPREAQKIRKEINRINTPPI